jgi:hypothetical protein
LTSLLRPLRLCSLPYDRLASLLVLLLDEPDTPSTVRVCSSPSNICFVLLTATIGVPCTMH